MKVKKEKGKERKGIFYGSVHLDLEVLRKSLVTSVKLIITHSSGPAADSSPPFVHVSVVACRILRCCEGSSLG